MTTLKALSMIVRTRWTCPMLVAQTFEALPSLRQMLNALLMEVAWSSSETSRKAGAEVTTQQDTIWAQILLQGTSSPKAELIALTWALHWGKNKQVNIYTDSRYAFATLHVHAVIYKERGFSADEGKTIKNKEKILALLEVAWLLGGSCYPS